MRYVCFTSLELEINITSLYQGFVGTSEEAPSITLYLSTTPLSHILRNDRIRDTIGKATEKYYKALNQGNLELIDIPLCTVNERSADMENLSFRKVFNYNENHLTTDCKSRIKIIHLQGLFQRT